MIKIRQFLLSSLTAAALTLGVQSAAAGDIVYSLGDSTLNYGTGGKNAETYDVALRISDPALVGVSIKGVRIAFPSVENLSGAKAWLTRELPAIKSSKAGDPDIASQDFTIAEGYNEVLFAEPYTITEEGVYVGYSFDAAKVDAALRPVVTTGYTSPDGFYIHTTKVYRTAWRSLYQTAGDLAIQVLLSGDAIKSNAAAVGSIPEVNTKTGEPTAVTFEVVNHGSQGIQSVDYTFEVAGQTASGHADLPTAISGIYSAAAEVSIQLPAIDSKGSYPLHVQIDKVNGVANEDAHPSETGLVNVYNTLPKHRAVVEEYTGTWCGYCPRGFVGLEEMQRLYPDDFIGISYHNGDPMEVVSSTDYPWNEKVLGDFPGFPSAAIDRVFQTDAFCGDSEYGTFGIDKTWLRRNEVFAPASVDVEAQWTDASQGTLEATAHVTFPLDRSDQPYEVGFVLVSDGLTGTGSSWSQSNYYSGAQGWPASMDEFTQGDSYVSGLTYNFVLVARSGIAGIEGSLSSPIVSDVAQSYSYQFDVAALGTTLVQDKSKLRVVALLINKETGEIVNANKVQAGGTTTAIGQIAHTGGEVVETVTYHDLQGRRVSQPRHGLYIKSETLRNGTVRSQKVRF